MSPKTATNNTSKVILTDEELSDIKDRLETLKAQAYKTDFKLDEFLDKNFTKEEKDLISLHLKSELTGLELEKSVDKILKALSDTEIVLIRLPFSPTVNFINWIKEFLVEKTNISNDPNSTDNSSNKNLILKIETDSNLLAGAEIEFKGKIKNNSIKNEVMKVLSSLSK